MSFVTLEFFTEDDRLRQICSQYWDINEQGEFTQTASKIAQGFDIEARGLTALVRENCRARSTQIKCQNCGTSFAFGSRTDYQRKNISRYRNSWICENCQADKVEKEREKQDTREAQQRKAIREHFDLKHRSVPIIVQNLALEDAVFLLSFIRLAATEDLEYIWPLETIEPLLAPTDELKYYSIRKMYEGHLIYVHPESPSRAFGFEDGIPTRFYLDRVMWSFPVTETNQSPKEIVEELEGVFRTKNWPEKWQTERLVLWKKIALDECLQYLLFSLNDHGLPFKPGEKTLLVLSNALEDFSVSQIYNFVWRSVKDAAAFYMREKVTKQHAANTVVGAIQRQLDRARAERWDVGKFRRDFRCPQSMVSQILYNVVLQIGDDGFDVPPGTR